MKKILVIPIVLSIIMSCNNSNNKAEMSSESMPESYASADSASVESIENQVSSSAAVERNSDPNRKFVRKADLKFRSKNVIQTTYDIENIVANQGGFVSMTDLKTDIEEVTTTNINSDSSIESTRFVVHNQMQIRVPNLRLDSTLRLIARNIDFLDFRSISAEDIALQIKSNQMTQSRLSEHESRMKNAIANRGRKLEETTNAEESLANRQERSDVSKIDNLRLLDQVNFSTISLNIYQREQIRHEVIANPESSSQYDPNLFVKIWVSIKDGWEIFEYILVFIVKFWLLLSIGFGLWYILTHRDTLFKK